MQACFDDVGVNCKHPYSVSQPKIFGPVHLEAWAPLEPLEPMSPAFRARPAALPTGFIRTRSNPIHPSVAMEILHSKQVVFPGSCSGRPVKSQSENSAGLEFGKSSSADPKSNQAKVHATTNGISRSSEKSFGIRFRTFMFAKEGAGVAVG